MPSQRKSNQENFRVAVFISGRGSNFKALATQIRQQHWPIEIVVVVSDKKDAPGLQFASAFNIPTVIVPRKPKERTQAQFNAALRDAILPYRPDLIVLAGFMRIVGPELIAAFPNKIINIHPSLLPAFRGLNAQQQALDAGVKFAGCSVHFVNEQVDAGLIIGQAVVPVLAGDTLEELEHRILVQEHKLLPEIVKACAEGSITVENFEGKERVVFKKPVQTLESRAALLQI